jgi:hypothetical protein
MHDASQIKSITLSRFAHDVFVIHHQDKYGLL